MIQIPVTNQPNQSFRVKIPLTSGNINLSFFIAWNLIAEYWQMSVSNADTGEEYLSNLPMITGQAPAQNLLRQFEYLAIGSAYIIPLSSATSDFPGDEDWGTNFILVWGD